MTLDNIHRYGEKTIRAWAIYDHDGEPEISAMNDLPRLFGKKFLAEAWIKGTNKIIVPVEIRPIKKARKNP